MLKNDAERLADELAQLDDVHSAELVHCKNRDGVIADPPEQHGTPDDDLYGVNYYAYDALIPHPVIEAIAKYDTGGIYIHPDPGTVTPRPEQ